jgi:hypothetical protein
LFRVFNGGGGRVEGRKSNAAPAPPSTFHAFQASPFGQRFGFRMTLHPSSFILSGTILHGYFPKTHRRQPEELPPQPWRNNGGWA